MEIVRARGLDMIEGDVLSDNHRVFEMVKFMGFQIQLSPNDSTSSMCLSSTDASSRTFPRHVGPMCPC